MEQGQFEEIIIRESIRSRKPLPAKVADAPSLLPGLDFYYTAFLQLCSCRAMGFGIGPVPWTAVNDYACRFHLTDDEFENFAAAVKHLDAAYVNWMDEKRKKDAPKRSGK